ATSVATMAACANRLPSSTLSRPSKSVVRASGPTSAAVNRVSSSAMATAAAGPNTQANGTHAALRLRPFNPYSLRDPVQDGPTLSGLAPAPGCLIGSFPGIRAAPCAAKHPSLRRPAVSGFSEWLRAFCSGALPVCHVGEPQLRQIQRPRGFSPLFGGPCERLHPGIHNGGTHEDFQDPWRDGGGTAGARQGQRERAERPLWAGGRGPPFQRWQ